MSTAATVEELADLTVVPGSLTRVRSGALVVPAAERAAALAVEVTDSGPTRLVVRGDVRLSTVAALRTALGQLLASGSGDVVVNLAGTRFHDVTGLGPLLSARRQAIRRGRRLVLEDPPASLLRLLAGTRLYRVLQMDQPPALQAGTRTAGWAGSRTLLR